MAGLRRQRLLLEIDLTRPLLELEPTDLVGRIRSRQSIRWRRLLAAVHDAGKSEQVAGIIATIGTKLSLTAAGELRAAIAEFRASGKPAIAWADSYGETATGLSAYLLATGFDEVWLQPSGAWGVAGIAAEVTFVRGVLDKLGIEPQLGQRYEYKTAADRIMRTEFTPAHEEMVRRLTDSAFEHVVAPIADGRSLTADEVIAAIDSGPMLASAALEARLVDKLGYRDEAYASARKACGGSITLRYAEQWRAPVTPATRVVRTVTKPPGVAVVNVFGEIAEGRSHRGLTGHTTGSSTTAGELRAARANPRVAAVVLRVDSPGGSAVASDTIWHEVARVRGAGKPVVVSMGELAGSGGYFVGCGADAIVADPITLTGSIGVVGGKAAIAGLLDRIGVTTGVAERGAHARMFSARRRFSDEEIAVIDGWLDEIYLDFKAKVAAGRSMSADEVEKVARGRVWTGADAAERGLVDTLGGMQVALGIAKSRAGLPAGAEVVRVATVPVKARLRPPTSSADPRAFTGSVSTPSSFSGLPPAVADVLTRLAPRVTGLSDLPRPSLVELVMPPLRFVG